MRPSLSTMSNANEHRLDGATSNRTCASWSDTIDDEDHTVFDTSPATSCPKYILPDSNSDSPRDLFSDSDSMSDSQCDPLTVGITECIPDYLQNVRFDALAANNSRNTHPAKIHQHTSTDTFAFTAKIQDVTEPMSGTYPYKIIFDRKYKMALWNGHSLYISEVSIWDDSYAFRCINQHLAPGREIHLTVSRTSTSAGQHRCSSIFLPDSPTYGAGLVLKNAWTRPQCVYSRFLPTDRKIHR